MNISKDSHVLVLESNRDSIEVDSAPPIYVEENLWKTENNLSLGGYFYDHICNSDGVILGIRYWYVSRHSTSNNPVLARFLKDARFLFDKGGHYVDIIFKLSDVSKFTAGALTIDVVQDFGGELVVSCGGLYGIYLHL